MPETRQCPRCLTWFTPKKSNQIYCVTTCKDAAHREEYGIGTLFLKYGIFNRAGLRRFYAVLNALGSPDRLARELGLSDPYTEEQGGSGENRGTE